MIGSMDASERARKFIGLICGFLLWLIWGGLVFSLGSLSPAGNNGIDIHDSLGAWVYLGPVPLIVGAGFYYFNRAYWSEMKQKQQSAVLMGGVIGFILWTLMIMTIPEIRTINGLFPNLAGWLFMLIPIFYFKRKCHSRSLPVK